MKKAIIVLSVSWLCVGFLLPSSNQAQRGSSSYVYQMYRGKEALARKNWYEAASHFRYALVWDHKGVEAHSGLGYVYLGLAEKQRAIDEFNAALRLKPHFSEAERGIHKAREAGEAEAAFHALEVQVKQEPNNAGLHATFAETLLDHDQVEEAKKEAEAALQLDPKLGHAYCALGRIAARQRDIEEARKNLEIAIKQDSTDDDAFTALGDLAMKANDFKLAVKYYRRVAILLPEETDAQKKLLEALTAFGDRNGADKVKVKLARLSQAPSSANKP